jgi:hypothetical protein
MMTDPIAAANKKAGGNSTPPPNTAPTTSVSMDRSRELKKRRSEAIPHKNKCISDQKTLYADEVTLDEVKQAAYSTNVEKYIKIVGEMKKLAAKRKAISKSNIIKGKMLFSYPIEKKTPVLPGTPLVPEKIEPYRAPKLPLKFA